MLDQLRYVVILEKTISEADQICTFHYAMVLPFVPQLEMKISFSNDPYGCIFVKDIEWDSQRGCFFVGEYDEDLFDGFDDARNNHLESGWNDGAAFPERE